MEITLLFPHQLFRVNPATAGDRDVFFFEDPLFFTQYRFHKNKLILHRATMKYAASYLEQNDFKTYYLNCQDYPDLSTVFELLKKKSVSHIHTLNPTDYLLSRRLQRLAKKQEIELSLYESPLFLLDEETVSSRMSENRNYLMARFYKKQRQAMNLLMEDDEPAGGKWSFDKENRKKLPEGEDIPDIYIPRENEYVREAREYVEKNFSQNPGDTDHFIFPVTYYQADKWLEDFLENRMLKFGDYEDAISTTHDFQFHSVLTPALNIGLLTPRQVIEKTMEWHRKKDYPINCLEGFIRQIIGWREFMRGIYVMEGVFQRTNNHFGHSRKLPPSFWDGSTGIQPIDDVIQKVLKYGYAHHIERLMILGNFMLLCEFDPDEVYQWFMELFIDAYDWVMVPNVYGMILFADGGLFATKPYISGSNYLRKMSHYKKSEWCDIWDGLYWRFLHVNREEMSRNRRMNMVMSLLDRMDKNTLENHLENADKFLNSMSQNKD